MSDMSLHRVSPRSRLRLVTLALIAASSLPLAAASVEKPVFSPPDGRANLKGTWKLSCATPGAVIRFAIGGSDPSKTSPEYKGEKEFRNASFTNGQFIVKAKAWSADGKSESAVATATYLPPLPKPSPPTLTPPGGEVSIGSAIVVGAPSDVIVRVAFGTADPGPSSSTIKGSIKLTENFFQGGRLELKARAYSKDGSAESEVVSGKYFLSSGKPLAPVLTPSGGEVAIGSTIIVRCASSDVDLHVAFGGADPGLSSSKIKVPIEVTDKLFPNGKLHVKVRAYRKGSHEESPVVSGNFFLSSGKPLAPVLTPPGGEVAIGSKINVSCASSDVTLRAAMGGPDPGPSSPKVDKWIDVTPQLFTNGKLRVKVRAYRNVGPGEGPVVTGDYTPAADKTAAPVFSPSQGEIRPGATITLTSSIPATIRYTFGKMEPTANAYAYSGPITVTEEMARRGPTLEMRARAFKGSVAQGPVATATFTFSQEVLPVPTISPGSGVFPGKVKVEIRSTAAGATIRYTTDGREPDASSRAYAGPFEVDTTKGATVLAKAFRTGAKESTTASATYRSTAAGPVRPAEFSPRSGTRFTGKLDVTISAPEADWALDIVVDGDNPEKGKAQRIGSAKITLVDSAHVSARVKAKDGRQSDFAGATYVRVPAPPKVTPGADARFQGRQVVDVVGAHPADVVEVEVDGPASQRTKKRGPGPFRLEITETATVTARSYSKAGESSPVVRVRLEREMKTTLK